MGKQNQYFPQSVSYPGETLEEKLQEIGMGPKEFAIRTGKPEKTITAVLNGTSSITSDMAIQFENVLNIPAHFWLNNQLSYDEYNARIKRQSEIAGAIVWANRFPFGQMAKYGWVKTSRIAEEKVEILFKFFGVASQTAWVNYYFGKKLLLNFRISLKHTNEPYAVSAWLRQGEILAGKMRVNGFDEKKFRTNLKSIKDLMTNQPDNCLLKLQNLCSHAGVKVVFTPCLPKAPIYGSTRWINDTPLIQLSDRFNRNDHFWFTFFHEAGHILLHGKKFISIENIAFDDIDTCKEKEADDFAESWTSSSIRILR